MSLHSNVHAPLTESQSVILVFQLSFIIRMKEKFAKPTINESQSDAGYPIVGLFTRDQQPEVFSFP